MAKKLKIAKGLWFAALIHGQYTVGKVQKEGKWFYLCQNKISGGSPKNKLGFIYSWCVEKGSKEKLSTSCVSMFQLFLKEPKDPKVLDSVFGYNTVLYPNHMLKIGCNVFDVDEVNKVVKKILAKAEKSKIKNLSQDLIVIPSNSNHGSCITVTQSQVWHGYDHVPIKKILTLQKLLNK